jgi:hypothetical protein
MANTDGPKTKSGRKVNVRPDTFDFRDRMFEPTLVEVPVSIDLAVYKKKSECRFDQDRKGPDAPTIQATLARILGDGRRGTACSTTISVQSQRIMMIHITEFISKEVYYG